MHRSIVLLLILTFGSVAAAADKPNVLLLIADDYCTALESYGREQCRTPNLDRLAKSGVSFDNAYCQFSVCGPSRASLMCGMYPAATGVLHNGGDFRRRLPKHATLAQLFRKHGYWSGRVSKIYHMGVPGDILMGTNGTDDRVSWDERFNVKGPEHLTRGKFADLSHKVGGNVANKIPAAQKRWYAGAPAKIVTPSQGSDFLVVEGADADEDQPDAQAANKAIELLEQRAADRKPFFLAVGFVRPHVPLVAPAKWFEPFNADEMNLAEQVAGDLDDLPAAAKGNTNAARYGMSDAQARRVLRGYYASVAFMDAQVGRVLAALDRLKLRENTIVVFTSDHGYHLGEHTMWQKLSVFEEGSKVPLIVSAPGQKAIGQRSSQIVELIDIYPTIAERAGLEAPPAVQGASFSNLLDDTNATIAKQDAYTITHNTEALRTKRWKYIEFGGGKSQPGDNTAELDGRNAALFDLASDPREYTNLAGKPQFEKIETELRHRLHTVREQAKQHGPRTK